MTSNLSWSGRSGYSLPSGELRSRTTMLVLTMILFPSRLRRSFSFVLIFRLKSSWSVEDVDR